MGKDVTEVRRSDYHSHKAIPAESAGAEIAWNEAVEEQSEAAQAEAATEGALAEANKPKPHGKHFAHTKDDQAHQLNRAVASEMGVTKARDSGTANDPDVLAKIGKEIKDRHPHSRILAQAVDQVLGIEIGDDISQAEDETRRGSGQSQTREQHDRPA